MKIKLFILCIFLLFIFAPQNTLFAQTEQEIDEVLTGFEDQEQSGDELLDVMDGFEDDTPAGIKENNTEEEEILEGFDTEDEVTKNELSEKSLLPSFLSIDGYIKLSTVYAFIPHEDKADTSWDGLTRLRPEIKLIMDVDLSENWQTRVSGHAFHDFAYTINDSDNYTDDVLDHYEQEIELDEVFLQGSLTKNLDLKTGRQIVVWGRSDNIRITDVLNPLDLRWPGLVDIENLRLPLTMSKLDYYYKHWDISGIILHEVRYNKSPEFGSDFFPGTQPLPDEQSPDEGLSMENSQFAASLNGIFQGWDMSLYFADIYAKNGYLSPISMVPAPQFEIKHARIKMVGGAFNIAWRNWLFKTEAAFFDGFEFSNTPEDTYARIDSLAGVEYMGISDATIAIEFANRHYTEFDKQLEDSPNFQKENLFECALRITKPYWNDTLNLTLVTDILGSNGDDGGFQRFSAEYDLTDSIEITGGIIFYQPGDLQRTMGIGDNDRIYFEVQYNF